MMVHYVASNWKIENATKQYEDKSCKLVETIVKSTMKGFKMPNREEIQLSLVEEGKGQLMRLL